MKAPELRESKVILVDLRSGIYCNSCRKELEKSRYEGAIYYYCRNCEKYLFYETNGLIRKI